MSLRLRRGEDPTAWFGPADREAVARAARLAEAGHAGEIVPCVVAHCAPPAVQAWPAAALGSLAAASLTALGLQALPWTAGGALELWILLPPFCGAAVGWLLGRLLPGLEVHLQSDRTLQQRVEQGARLAFLAESVFRTRDRSGILIFVALRERRVTILADEGIHAVVPATAWETIVADLTGSLRAGRPREGLIDAIAACGRLLSACGPQLRPDETNELSDALRLAPATENRDA